MKGKKVQDDLQQDKLSFAVGYAYRATQDFVNHLAASIQIPYSAIAERLSALLSGREGGQSLGFESGMPGLQGSPAERGEESTTLDDGSLSNKASLRGRYKMSAKARAAIGVAKKQWWAKKGKKAKKKSKAHLLPKGEATRLALKFLKKRQITHFDAVKALAKKYPKTNVYVWNAALTNARRNKQLIELPNGLLKFNQLGEKAA